MGNITNPGPVYKEIAATDELFTAGARYVKVKNTSGAAALVITWTFGGVRTVNLAAGESFELPYCGMRYPKISVACFATGATATALVIY